MRRWLALAVVTLTAGTARAEDPPQAPVAAPAAPTPPRVSPEQAADAVLAARKANDDAALEALAAKDDPDPWLVADELIRRGAHDAAEAFAREDPRADTQSLPTYVATRRELPEDGARRARLAAANHALDVGNPPDVLAALGPPESAPARDVIGVRIAFGRGLALAGVRRLPEASRACAEAAQAAERLGWISRAARAYAEAGRLAWQGSDFSAAIRAFEVALRLFERRSDQGGAARSLHNIGSVHAELGRYDEAIAAWERSLAMKRALGDGVGAATTLASIGCVQADLGRHAQALSTLGRALAEQEALGDQRGLAMTLGNIGTIQQSHGEFDQALATYERARAVMEALGDRTGAATELTNIGTLRLARGEYREALTAFDQARTVFEALGDRAGEASALAGAGGACYQLGDITRAVSSYERALAMQRTIGSPRRTAGTLRAMSLVHAALGDYSTALSLGEQALEISVKIGDKEGAAEARLNLGVSRLWLGDYAAALATFESALAESEALGSRNNAARALANLAIVYRRLGDPRRALAADERALTAFESMGSPAMAATTLGNIGSDWLTLGDYAKSVSAYERALAAKEAVGDKLGAAATVGNMGSALIRARDFPQALVVCRRAMSAHEALGDRVGAAIALVNIGIAQRELGDLKEARSSIERAVRLARSARTAPLLVDGLQELARLDLASGSPARALGRAHEGLLVVESLLGGLGEEDGAATREQHADLLEIGALAAAREEDAAEALTFLESGRAGALLDSLGKREALRWKAETLPEDLRAADAQAQATERVARQAYDRAFKGDDRRAIAAGARALDDALDGVRNVNARIQREAKRAAGLFYPRAAAIEQVEASLEKGEVLVLYGRCLDEELALVVRTDGEAIVNLGPRAPVEAAVEALDASDPKVDPASALAALRKALVEPLALGPGVKRVVVSPEGPLCYVPFGALFDVPVALTPSGTTHVLLRDEEREPGTGILALGDPDYAGVSEGAKAIYVRGRPLVRLEATKAEAEQVGTTTLLGAKASEDGLRAALGTNPHWRAVHFACHGLVDPERPTLSALALSGAGEQDGFLTALEVVRMKIPADLAVLSACETGKGKIVQGEGIVGLTRAFMYAGAPRVICSLWKVDDDATRALMTEFYRLWNPKDGTPGLPTAEALRMAQALVRDDPKHPEWKHPYYWAAWVLWGLPD